MTQNDTYKNIHVFDGNGQPYDLWCAECGAFTRDGEGQIACFFD